jgi:hypothetical protein
MGTSPPHYPLDSGTTTYMFLSLLSSFPQMSLADLALPSSLSPYTSSFPSKMFLYLSTQPLLQVAAVWPVCAPVCSARFCP